VAKDADGVQGRGGRHEAVVRVATLGSGSKAELASSGTKGAALWVKM
jgi:hypothetical protein